MPSPKTSASSPDTCPPTSRLGCSHLPTSPIAQEPLLSNRFEQPPFSTWLAYHLGADHFPHPIIDLHSCTPIPVNTGPQPIYSCPPHLPWHPNSSSWGCYVHRWNGQVGLCLPSPHWVLLHTLWLQHGCQVCAKPCCAGPHFLIILIVSLDNS